MSKAQVRWLTKEERETAKRNGISRLTLYRRVYELDWEIERAITDPVKKGAIIDGYREQCEENGISPALFINRVRGGMSKEKASTKPPEVREQNRRTCEVEGCHNKHKAKGLCASHYNKRRRENIEAQPRF
jgi:hypothetical protein